MKQNIKLGISTVMFVLLTMTTLAQQDNADGSNRETLDKKRFNTIDLNGDGFISFVEYNSIPRKKKIPKETLEKVFKKIDQNKDNGISISEYLLNRKRLANKGAEEKTVN